MKKLALIGLDGVGPGLLGGLFPHLPVLGELAKSGTFARLWSVDPPITIPAWMCMFTGKDPGELGVYGFRNRIDHSYLGLSLASSMVFRASPVWETLGRLGYRSILIGIPGTYPPKPVRGMLVAGFPVPDNAVDYTYPSALREKIQRWVGNYMFDARGFRTEDKANLLDRVYAVTEQRFALARRLVAEEEWDFFALVDMGPDRIHHAFLADHDSTHPKHNPRSPFQDALREYYRFLDERIGELISDFPLDTQILVVSDHGAKPLLGGIGINEWLIQEGYLALTEYPKVPTPLGDLISAGSIDWAHTVAWGEGGYYGRLCINVAGREPEGIVAPNHYEEIRMEIAFKLAQITGEDGRPSLAFRPEELYREVNGIPPDLLVYFGDLSFRSISTVGWRTVRLPGNDTGPDDANHARDGIFIAYPSDEERQDRSILEIKAWILNYFGV